MHLGIHACVDLADSLLAANVKEENLFVRTNTDGEGAICRHLDAMNVTTVSAQISDIDACFRIPYFYILVDLTTTK